MSSPHTESAQPRRPVSRRNVTQGLAWSVPAVAAVAAAPAEAASGCKAGCYPLRWSTTGSAATTAQTLTATANGSTISVPVTPSLGTGYRLPAGTTYTPLNLNSSGGTVDMSTYVDPAASVAVRNASYAALKLEYPACAGGPITFTISGIDSYTTSANDKGAQYFTDAVQVLNDGTVVAPTSSTGVNQAAGWTVAAGTPAGTATYTIADPGTLEIRLRNAYSGSMGSSPNPHPNQTIQISPLSCVGVAPPECTPSVSTGGGISFDWGRPLQPDKEKTDQVLWFAGSGGVAGLPADARITSITWDLTVQNRDDNVNGGTGPGVYEPSNAKLCNEPAGLVCDVSYGSVSGCEYAPYYDDTQNPKKAIVNKDTGVIEGPKGILYNGGGQTTGDMWNPKNSKAVSIKLISNWQPFDFQNGVVAPAWTVRFTADPAKAQALLSPDVNGCLGFTKAQSKDTPLLNLQYCGVKAAKYGGYKPMNLWGTFTVTYTSAGQTHTLVQSYFIKEN